MLIWTPLACKLYNFAVDPVHSKIYICYICFETNDSCHNLLSAGFFNHYTPAILGGFWRALHEYVNCGR
eukprot:COSAG05_NODE_5_length_47078_cov_547.868814_24_plen_69_part_00